MAYIEREAVEKAVFIKQEQERQHWIEYLKQFRGIAGYSSKEQTVDNWLRGYGEAVENLLAIFETLPAADVVEVKHGYWKRTEEPLGWQDVTLAECSVCGEGWLTDDNFSIEEFVDYWHYCPNCGAKMDLKEGADNGS